MRPVVTACCDFRSRPCAPPMPRLVRPDPMGQPTMYESLLLYFDCGHDPVDDWTEGGRIADFRHRAFDHGAAVHAISGLRAHRINVFQDGLVPTIRRLQDGARQQAFPYKRVYVIGHGDAGMLSVAQHPLDEVLLCIGHCGRFAPDPFFKLIVCNSALPLPTMPWPIDRQSGQPIPLADMTASEDQLNPSNLGPFTSPRPSGTFRQHGSIARAGRRHRWRPFSWTSCVHPPRFRDRRWS
jgi:hypothetical protein